MRNWSLLQYQISEIFKHYWLSFVWGRFFQANWRIWVWVFWFISFLFEYAMFSYSYQNTLHLFSMHMYTYIAIYQNTCKHMAKHTSEKTTYNQGCALCPLNWGLFVHVSCVFKVTSIFSRVCVSNWCIVGGG